MNGMTGENSKLTRETMPITIVDERLPKGSLSRVSSVTDIGLLNGDSTKPKVGAVQSKLKVAHITGGAILLRLFKPHLGEIEVLLTPDGIKLSAVTVRHMMEFYKIETSVRSAFGLKRNQKTAVSIEDVIKGTDLLISAYESYQAAHGKGNWGWNTRVPICLPNGNATCYMTGRMYDGAWLLNDWLTRGLEKEVRRKLCEVIDSAASTFGVNLPTAEFNAASTKANTVSAKDAMEILRDKMWDAVKTATREQYKAFIRGLFKRIEEKSREDMWVYVNKWRKVINSELHTNVLTRLYWARQRTCAQAVARHVRPEAVGEIDELDVYYENFKLGERFFNLAFQHGYTVLGKETEGVLEELIKASTKIAGKRKAKKVKNRVDILGNV